VTSAASTARKAGVSGLFKRIGPLTRQWLTRAASTRSVDRVVAADVNMLPFGFRRIPNSADRLAT